MRKLRCHLGYVVCVCLLGMFLASCSMLGKSKPAEKSPPQKSQPQKPAAKKPEKEQPPKPDAESLIQTGIAYREQGDLKKALAAFKQVLKAEPDNAAAASQLQETQQAVDAAIEAHLKQGIKYFTHQDLQEAMTEWNKVLALDPANKKALDYKTQTQQQLDALGNQ